MDIIIYTIDTIILFAEGNDDIGTELCQNMHGFYAI